MKICIVKLSAMGDIIHSMIALQFIKAKIPNCQIDWIVEDGFKGILENNPHIDNILPINLKSIKTKKSKIFNQIKILNKYAKNNYDLVIDAQGLIKSAIVSKIVGNKVVGSKIVGNKVVGSKIVGFDKYSIREGIASWFYDQTVNIGYEKNVINRNIKVICEPLDIKVNKKDILNKKPFLYSRNQELNIQHSIFNIIFIVGASKSNKIYPKEKFLEVANNLSDKKIEVIWANDKEKEVAQYLQNNANNVTMCEKMNLDNLKFKINNSALIIGGDTGPTHMAWGLNIPSITVFGNTPHTRNTYETNINKVIKSISCVNALKLDKNDFSIQNIDANEISSMALELLK